VHEQLPIIDISPALQRRSKRLACRGCTNRSGLPRLGFFYIKGHPISTERIAAVLDHTQRFFALPAAEKLKIDITQTRHHRGYGAIATEQLDPSKPSDLKETFDMGLHLPVEHPEVLAEKPLRGPNRHPSQAGWANLMEQHYLDMQALAQTLLRAMTLALDIERDFFDSRFNEPGQRAAHDPLPTAPHRQFRRAARRRRAHRLRLHHPALSGQCRRPASEERQRPVDRRATDRRHVSWSTSAT
jgi:isopenicillin N synthase-like dioxygenase